MITSGSILKSIKESLAQPGSNEEIIYFGSEILKKLADMSYISDYDDEIAAPRAEFLYLKRNIPESAYHGKAFRFIAISEEPAVRAGIYPTIDAAREVVSPDIRSLRKYVLDYSKVRGQYVSWSKTIDGLLTEMRWRDIKNWGQVVFIFSDIVDGIDLRLATESLIEKCHAWKILPDEYDLKKRLEDFGANEELLAIMTPSIKLEGAYVADDLISSDELLNFRNRDQQSGVITLADYNKLLWAIEDRLIPDSRVSSTGQNRKEMLKHSSYDSAIARKLDSLGVNLHQLLDEIAIRYYHNGKPDSLLRLGHKERKNVILDLILEKFNVSLKIR